MVCGQPSRNRTGGTPARNERQGWQGYLWQGRFASAPMDEAHLRACARYVELNPVRAKLAADAAAWPWSSARAHLSGCDGGLVRTAAMLERVDDWAQFLAGGLSDEELAAIRHGESTGRPLGSTDFVKGLEAKLDRVLAPMKVGRKARVETGK
jgi:putative transposase